jgi:hypothetical protein
MVTVLRGGIFEKRVVTVVVCAAGVQLGAGSMVKRAIHLPVHISVHAQMRLLRIERYRVEWRLRSHNSHMNFLRRLASAFGVGRCYRLRASNEKGDATWMRREWWRCRRVMLLLLLVCGEEV